MSGPTPSLALGKALVDTLKRAGLVELAAGGGDRVVRELAQVMEPSLAEILARISSSDQRVMGEVTSTFGDEAADEAVEDLVETLCEVLLDSDGVEDVFADDPTIERTIFRFLAAELMTLAETHDAEDAAPPISVRLDTLGYVAANAARAADAQTLADVLGRAAESAQSELSRYDDVSRTAFFAPGDPDPERRIDIEAAIEEELSELVDLGVLDLPSLERTVKLERALDRPSQKALFRAIDGCAQRHLSHPVCPGSWAWAGPDSIKVTFTPLSEPDPRTCDKLLTEFERAVHAAVAQPGGAAPDAALLALAKAAFAMESSLLGRPASPPGREQRPKSAQPQGVTEREPDTKRSEQLGARAPARDEPAGPDAAEPKAAAKPRAAEPKATRAKPKAAKPKPARAKPGSDKPKAAGAEPKAERPKAERPKAERPKADKRKAERPKADKRKADKLEAARAKPKATATAGAARRTKP